jgi:hypothetical protein
LQIRGRGEEFPAFGTVFASYGVGEWKIVNYFGVLINSY